MSDILLSDVQAQLEHYLKLYREVTQKLETMKEQFTVLEEEQAHTITKIEILNVLCDLKK